MDTITGATLRPGNSIELLRNGEELFPRLWDDLARARHSITLATYFGESGAVTERLRDVLVDRALAGARILILYDPVGTRGIGGGYFDALSREEGIQAHPLRPLRLSGLHRWNARVHLRSVVIDGEIGYTGGFGLSDAWLGDGRHPGEWRDTAVRVTGPVVADLQAAFGSLWAEATGTLPTSRRLFGCDSNPALGPHLAGFLYSSPGPGSTPAERLVVLSIAAARERLYIASGYFAPGGGVLQLLTHAAQRGVDVRILTATREHTDIPLVYWAGRATYQELLRGGVRLYEYRPSMMHAKYIIVDAQWCSLGGVNLDNRALALNTEGNLNILDRDLTARVEHDFLLDLEESSEMHLDQFASRGWSERLRERGAHLLAPLL